MQVHTYMPVDTCMRTHLHTRMYMHKDMQKGTRTCTYMYMHT